MKPSRYLELTGLVFSLVGILFLCMQGEVALVLGGLALGFGVAEVFMGRMLRGHKVVKE